MYKEELCAGFWVKGFKVKVDQDKSSLYLKIASRLVLTNSWPQEAREMILGLGCHVGRWAAQDPPSTALGAAFPTLQPCWKAGKLAMFSSEVRSWILMYNVLILILANNFFFSKKNQWELNLHNNVLGSAFNLCRFLFLV